ncbi:MAG TPA: glycosyltransferase family 4 protein [Candidatus Binatia bacterium]|nr:glycosyltransferase family 4 protein [Candidatus Binatia bacterium]
MKILFVNALYEPNVRGGAERAIQNLAEALASAGAETVVASTVGAGKGSERNIRGVKVVYLPIANLHWPYDRVPRSSARRKLWHLADIYNLAMKVRLRRLMRDESPDIVHTSNLQGISVSAWRAASAERIPVLHTLQDYYLTCGRCTRYHNGRTCERTCWDCLPLLIARRRASACVSAVVGISRYILCHHREHGFFSAAKFSDVIAHDSPTVAAPAPVRPAGRPLTFGYFGRIVPEKGIERLIDAFNQSHGEGSRLLIAGEGEGRYQRDLRGRQSEGDNRDAIEFLGWIAPAEFFRQVDVLVLPSLWHEPLARVIVEANAHGVPVIGSARGGIPEGIEDGVTGLLFEPDEPGALPAAIDRLMREPSLVDKLGENARRRARDYAADRVVAKYLNAYSRVLALQAAGERLVTGPSER